MMLTFFPAALASPDEPGDSSSGEGESIETPVDAFDETGAPPDEFVDADEEVDGLYEGAGTIYDLSNEVDVEPEPEEPPPPEDPVKTEETICLSCGEMSVIDIDMLLLDEAYCPVCGELLSGEFIAYDAENALQLQGEYVLDEIIVKFVEPWQVPGRERQLQREIAKVEKIGHVEGLNVFVIKVDDLRRSPNAVLNRFKNNRFVEYVEPNYVYRPEMSPNDPSLPSQIDALNLINAFEGWDFLSGSSAVPIAIIDSGIASHPDLPPPLKSYSAVAGLAANNDTQGHGTGVAGVVGMIGNNGKGGAGINWNASIINVKVDDAKGVLSTANIAKGIMWAADNGARIINLSLGMTADSITLKNAIDYAYNKGVAIFAASGNDGTANLYYPARYPNVFAVGSTTNGTSRRGTSTYGPNLNAMAIGVVYTTSKAGSYSSREGTSFAAPQAAALASLIWAINPDLKNHEIYRMIEQGAKPMRGGFNEQTGYGLIDVGNTIRLARATVAPPAATVQLPPETKQETRDPPNIILTGFTTITLEYGQPYIEVGYKAADFKGNDITSAVLVTSNVDIWTAGLYSITYEVADPVNASLTARATRTVTVSPKPPDPPPRTAPIITIIGSNPIILHRDSTTPYTEQMARATDFDGTDISRLVTVTGSVNRRVAGTYRLTYSITSPETGLISTATRDVRIIAPNEKREARAKYGVFGQGKQGAKITHTGMISSGDGFMDLAIASIGSNTVINVKFVDTASGRAIWTDTYSAAGSRQYKIDSGRYQIEVEVTKANGNTSYAFAITMPEAVTTFYDADEVPLFGLPQIAPIGSNPIILHIGGTPYFEQGARAVDHLGNDISDGVVITGVPDTSTAGEYIITYTVIGALGLPSTATRLVRILDPNDETDFLEPEVPLAQWGETVKKHIVKVGDTLWGISKRYYGTGTRWGDIYEANRDVIGKDPRLILPGMELAIIE